ncbi:MAG: hypothetical protein DMF42_06750 [Verrucomicrobia bacterium]|nr:MAG: hypothetical protein DME74_05825 [Verrucomicrobiota bacterium]PYL42489.1 MAG: hypothetical protein DMF42_06750 [Verrucomicrobiota bacterium]
MENPVSLFGHDFCHGLFGKIPRSLYLGNFLTPHRNRGGSHDWVTVTIFCEGFRNPGPQPVFQTMAATAGCTRCGEAALGAPC